MRIGIDLGGTKIEAIALDGHGNERARKRIASPRGDYAAGDHVGYSRGTPMGEFYSRALGRTFERILFVETIAPVGQKVEPNVSR